MMAYQPALDEHQKPNERAFGDFTERRRLFRHYETRHPEYLAMMRVYAVEIARKNGTVIIDEVRRRATERGFPLPEDIGVTERIFGQLLYGCKDLEACGCVESTRPERIKRSGRNSSMITVYKIRTERSAQ
jgi:hypothetical protein